MYKKYRLFDACTTICVMHLEIPIMFNNTHLLSIAPQISIRLVVPVCMIAAINIETHITLRICPSGLKIGFTEVDYKTTEPEGTLSVTLVKDGENTGPLSFTLTPLTYSEFSNLGFVRQNSKPLPDAAECKPFSFSI